MVDTKTSQEAAAAALTGPELVRGVQSGANVKITIDQIKDYIVVKGTFEPALLFSGGSVGVTYASRAGTFTKIGDRVFFDLHINLSSKGTSTGNTALGGLPFAAAATVRVPVAQSEKIDLDTAGGRYSLNVAVSGTTLRPTGFRALAIWPGWCA